MTSPHDIHIEVSLNVSKLTSLTAAVCDGKVYIGGDSATKQLPVTRAPGSILLLVQ